ncbi:ABC transporter permease subunit (plasmid) [Neorhizobium galegae]|nr:ABC transporter permease subunit [Neorhizobium galegae]
MTAMDFAYILEALPDLMTGLKMTLIVSFLAIVLSCLIGLLGAVLRTSGVKPLQYAVTAYVEFIRGTPYLVQIFFIFYGLPSLGAALQHLLVRGHCSHGLGKCLSDRKFPGRARGRWQGNA